MLLSKNWRLSYDDNNVNLEFFEDRERKKKGTDEKEPFEFVEPYHYPTIKTALIAFQQKYIKGSESVTECLKRIDEVETIIKNLQLN